MEIRYIPPKTLIPFFNDTKFVEGLMGPIGSGKSVACVIRLILIAHRQQPDKNNVRRTRFAIIRNTYRELLDTTMATFFTWVDKETGSYSALNMTFTLEQEQPDGTTVLAEFMFRALDRPEDIKKLLSLEITAAWINEARELPKAVIDMAQGRVGRYPSRFIHVAPTWFGLIMDTNPPDVDHWWYELFEENLPENHSIYRQPSGLSQEAENIDNLPPNYYVNMQAGKTRDWVNVYIHGQYGFVMDGRVVYPEYNDDIHYNSNLPDPNNVDTTRLYVGIDFGLTPAAVIAYRTSSGAMRVIDELVTFNMGSMAFGKLLKQKLSSNKYSKCTVELWGDPAGEQRAQTDETTPFMVLQNQGLAVFPAHTNDVSIRRETVAALLTALDHTGKPMFQVGPNAPMFRKAMMGGYKYRRLQISGSEKYVDKPDKNQYSHVAEAGQYMCLGVVGDTSVIGGYSNKLDYSKTQRLIA